MDKLRGRWRQRRPWAPLAEQEGCLAGAFITRRVGRRDGAAGGAGSGTGQVPAGGPWQGPLLGRAPRTEKNFFPKNGRFGILGLIPEPDLQPPRSRHEAAHALFCARNTTPRCGRREGGALSRRGDLERGRRGDGHGGAESETRRRGDRETGRL